MKAFFCFAAAAALSAQVAPPAPNIPPTEDKVVAVVEGVKYTISDLERIVRALPPGVSNNFYRDKKAFLKEWGFMLRLVHSAQKERVEEMYPHKERLEYNRNVYLMNQAFDLQRIKIQVSEEERKKAYEELKSSLSEAKVKVIYIAYNDNPAPGGDPKTKKPLKQEEARIKAEGLVKKLRAGADFAAVAKAESDDRASSEKGGEFPNIKADDTSIPPAIKAAVFVLKPGQVSDPVIQANGFYIFKCDEITTPPFEQVRDKIYEDIQQKRLFQWMDDIKKSLKIEFVDESYLSEKTPRK